MKASEIKIGAVYRTTIRKKEAPVRIDKKHEEVGWVGTNLNTHRTVHIKDTEKIRERVEDAAESTATPAPVGRAKKRLSKKERAASRSESQADPSAETKKVGCLDAAVQVLAKAGKPMTSGQMMERILDLGLWTTVGRTPAATLYSAILREIQRKGKTARFVRAERGMFALNR